MRPARTRKVVSAEASAASDGDRAEPAGPPRCGSVRLPLCDVRHVRSRRCPTCVARLRRRRSAGDAPPQHCGQIITVRQWPRCADSAARPDHLQVEVADLLAQGVAVDAEQFGGPDLVAARRGQRRADQRAFDLAQDAVIEAGRRQLSRKPREIVREVALDRVGQRLPTSPGVTVRSAGCASGGGPGVELGLDDRPR